jgi:hypothetical protein
MKTGKKLVTTLTTGAIALLISSAAYSMSHGMAASSQPVPEDSAMAPQMMGQMDPQMMENMMKMRQQRMAECQAQGGPMRGENCMQMDPEMRQRMMQMHKQRMNGGMPMDGENSEMMLDPMMRRNMMQQRMQRMQQGGMPMSGQDNDMMMDPMMRQNMMQMRQQRQQQMMGKGMHHGMGHHQCSDKNPQMKQNMMEMRQQHMEKMEQRLSKIEALLEQLVEQNKAK